MTDLLNRIYGHKGNFIDDIFAYERKYISNIIKFIKRHPHNNPVDLVRLQYRREIESSKLAPYCYYTDRGCYKTAPAQ